MHAVRINHAVLISKAGKHTVPGELALQGGWPKGGGGARTAGHMTTASRYFRSADALWSRLLNPAADMGSP